MIVYREMRREDVPFISRLEEETFSMPWSAASFLQMIEKEIPRILWRRRTDSFSAAAVCC